MLPMRHSEYNAPVVTGPPLAAQNNHELSHGALSHRSQSPGPRHVAPIRTPQTTSPQLLVQVLVDGPDGQRLTLPVHTSETIKELKMLLNNKSWFTSKHCLFFGDRELLDHHQVADVVERAQQGSDAYLHVFVRTKDVRFGRISTTKSCMSFGNQPELEDSSHTTSRRSLDIGTPKHTETNALQTTSHVSELNSSVLHVVIRKNAQVAFNAARTGEFQLTVRANDTAASLKQQLLPQGDCGQPSIVGDVHVYHNGVKLLADRPLIEYGLNDGDVLDIVPWEPTVSSEPSTHGDEVIPLLRSPSHQLNICWQKAADGLRAGIHPELAPSGSGGSYFLYDTNHEVVAVFKPVDEEPNMRNNPRGFAPTADFGSPSSTSTKDNYVRRGVFPGEGAYREIAAYILDHDHRANVPATAPVHLTYPDGSAKHGSLQEFVKSDCDCEEMGNGVFPVSEVHKIAVLDLRLANADRNESNILARQQPDKTWTLIPIDHGYCLPSHWSDMSFGWSSWRQAKTPFSEETCSYIASIDPEKDLALLEECGIVLRPACATIFKAANLLLKKVAARGLTPKHAADILERSTLRKSTMEKMHRLACERSKHEDSEASGQSPMAISNVTAVQNDRIYLKHLAVLIDEYLDELQDSP